MTNHRRNPIVIVQGGQWGSEAKGAVAAALCLSRPIDIAVRTGAINAGHTVVYNNRHYAMQQIPTGWVNPNTQLVIGAGAYIHPPTLWREIEMISEAMPNKNVIDRLFIDSRCGTHLEAAEQLSKDANRHHSIGATGKGCSEAIINKIRNRNNGAMLFVEWLSRTTDKPHLAGTLQFVDTVQMLNDEHDKGAKLLIEGTQGTLLDLHLGPYPYTTSRMTSAANWVAECGLSPSLPYEVVLVCRTYPIRVAGNSGPMSNEIEWTDLANNINNKLSLTNQPPLVSVFALEEFKCKLEYAASEATIEGKYKVPTEGRTFRTRLSEWTPAERNTYRVAASELHRDALKLCSANTVIELRKLFEMTTVTKKLRRVADLNVADLKYAVAINRPSWIALTFLDYLVPQIANATADTIEPATQGYIVYANKLIEELESKLGVPVKFVSTGPKPENFISTTCLKVRQSQR